MTATEEALRLTEVAALAANAKKGLDIVAFDVSEALAITDVFLIVSARNERLVGAIVDAIEERLIAELDARPIRREGDRQNRWVLLDYVDVVVHVQHTEERSLYSLERLWKDCPRIDLHLPDPDLSGTDEDADETGADDGDAADADEAGTETETDADETVDADFEYDDDEAVAETDETETDADEAEDADFEYDADGLSEVSDAVPGRAEAGGVV